MRIRNVTIEQWRSFQNVRLDFPDDAPLVCLVGENGTGKSSILDLIANAMSYLGVRGFSTSSYGSPGAGFGSGDQAALTIALGPVDRRLVIESLPETLPPHGIELSSEQRINIETGWDGTIEVAFGNSTSEPILRAGGSLTTGKLDTLLK